MNKTLLIVTLSILAAPAPDANARERGGELKLSDAQKSQQRGGRPDSANRQGRPASSGRGALVNDDVLPQQQNIKGSRS
ncbi:MAG: hypothetical protein ACFHXK_07265 [bacterium]